MDLYQNFTPRAQQVLALARCEASRLNHNFVGTEHLLLGVIKLGQGVAVNVLQKMGIDLEMAKGKVEQIVGMGPAPRVGNAPYTPRVKQVLAIAAQEARVLDHKYLGTEHILLGLIQEGNGVAARVLKDLGVEADKSRQEILKELDPNYGAGSDTLASRVKLPQEPPAVDPRLVDTTKQYDIYCSEGAAQLAVYRNALFKGARSLLSSAPHDPRTEFLELEQANGETVFVARSSVVKFCEPAGERGSHSENAR